MKHPTAADRPAPEAEPPCLPGFRTWRGVYGFVFSCFVLWIVLLAALTWTFS